MRPTPQHDMHPPSASARENRSAGYGETSPKPLRGEGGHHGVDWVDIAAGFVLMAEVLEHWHQTHHWRRPTILTAITTFALGAGGSRHGARDGVRCGWPLTACRFPDVFSRRAACRRHGASSRRSRWDPDGRWSRRARAVPASWTWRTWKAVSASVRRCSRPGSAWSLTGVQETRKSGGNRAFQRRPCPSCPPGLL